MGPKQMKQTLVKLIANGLPALIKGAPGVGKTDIITQVAAELKQELILSHPVVSDPTDYKGLPGIVDGMAEFLPYGDLRRLIEAKRPTIFFLDDLGQAPACVQAAAMQLILARRVNGHRVSNHITFVAATNRREDKAGVTGILEPVKSRFATILELQPSVEDWVEWAINNDIPSVLIGWIYFQPDMLMAHKPTADIVNGPCPRTIANAGKLINIGLTDIETLSGAIGEGAATQLVAFMKIHDQLPSLSDIEKEPETTPIPTEPSARYAVVGALVSHCSPKNALPIMTYGSRLPEEFAVLLFKDICRKDKKNIVAICNNNVFKQFAMRHSDILLPTN